MIADTSAIVAFILDEAGAERLAAPLLESAAGAPTLAEAGIVLHGRAPDSALGSFLEWSGMLVLDFTHEHWSEAVRAYRRYGKGRHAAGLNLGDCLAYAVARLADEPLLTLDEGFAHTDLELV